MTTRNPTANLFRAAGQFNGLSPLDESVATAREYQATIGRLERQLALKDEAVAHLQQRIEVLGCDFLDIKGAQ